MRAWWLVLLGVVLLGCGSRTAPPPAGRAQVTVHWPARTRVVPNAAESLVVAVHGAGDAAWRFVLNRPADGTPSLLTIDALPVGTLTVTAAAFPAADGQGVAQATGTAPLTITPDTLTHLALTLTSTITRLEVAPTPVTLAAPSSVTLQVSPRDAAGALVLVTPGSLHWESADAQVACVNNGVVSGVAAGTTTVTVREPESGVAQTVPVTVTAVNTGKIAYTVASGGVKEIWLMNPDGSNPHQLTHFGETCDELSFSPDGSQLAFILAAGTRSDIYLMNADGSNARRISRNDRCYWGPTFHPTGASLVAFETFTSDDIVTLDLDGANEKKLTSDAVPDVLPVYLPDASAIIFDRKAGASYDLYRMNVDGTGLTPLANTSADEWYHAVSPDGAGIAYTCGDNLAMIDTNGSNRRVFPVAAGTQDKRPTFSPDGTQLAFASNRGGAWQIYAMNRDGTNVHQLTTGVGEHEYPQWGR